MALTKTQVSELYVAIFGRASEGDGNTYWQTNQPNRVTTADVMLATDAAKEYFNSSLDSNQAFIEHIYENTLGKSFEDDPDGINYWVAELESGKSRGEVVVALIDAAYNPLNYGDAQLQFTNKVTVSNYTADRIATADPENLGVFRGYIAGVTHDPATVAAAEADVLAGESVGFNITAETAAGAGVMRITGDMSARIDFTNPANQVKGLDLNGNGVIANDGIENTIQGEAAGYEIVDAYARNPQNEYDRTHNFLADIAFDGTGFAGDGVNTDGNIYLGGLGVDVAFGGIGNDFMAGGGVAEGRFVRELNSLGNIVIRDTLTGVANPVNQADWLSGGRNADFFFVELSALDPTDGNGLTIDGGNTTDNSSAGLAEALSGWISQNNDWLLLEASDDDEPVTVCLGAGGFVNADTSGRGAGTFNLESVDASGNLYGFINDIDVKIGGRATDLRSTDPVVGTENYGIGSTAQLNVTGSAAANVIIGGYDNDRINGDAGNDILLGGNMQFFEDYDNNPNILEIPNDGIDQIFGDSDGNADGADTGAGVDNILFEMDKGVYDGGEEENLDDAANDTLWITDYTPGASTSTLDAMTTDETIRIDLGVGKAGGLNNYSGYGGADKNYVDNDYTADQTKYVTSTDRAQVQDFESVIATGLGAIDYDTDGTNNSELNFTDQMNFFGIDADLDLRGTAGVNTLYANTGADHLEGREGNDNLSGGDGLDTFIFYLDQGDGLDVIHRQVDANDDNIWDGTYVNNIWVGTYGQDFGVDSASSVGASSLVVDFGTTDLSSADVAVTTFTINIGGTVFSASTAALTAANSAEEVAEIVDAAFSAQDANVSATFAGNTVVVNDTLGRNISDTVAEGYYVSLVISNGNASANAEFFPSGVTTTEDTLVFASYEETIAEGRPDGELVDDDGFVNETGDAVTLGGDGYAEDLVVRFGADANGTTVLAEDQCWDVRFQNLADEDTISISVNGTAFALQMGVAANGTAIGETMPQFLARMVDLINAGSDNDTLAGTLVAAFNGVDTISLTQGNYNGGQVAYMDKPIVTLGNASGGEPARYTISEPNTDTEVTLLNFDGRDNNLNEGNVLFLGGSGMNNGVITNADNSRSILATADDTDGGDLLGSDALVVDSMTDANTVATDFSLHGDDLLFTGDADDDVVAGTGDDRVFGSIGDDTVDGGKDLYVVQTLAAGVMTETVEVLNEYDADQRALDDDVINVHPLEQDAAAGARAGFNDTLVFSTNDFNSDTQFTITVDDDLSQMDGGAGTVGVDIDGDGGIGASTTFVEMEAIRTLAGDGTHAGQGNDTLDVSDLSDAVAATGSDDPDAALVYNMTSELGLIQINADLNDDDEINDDVNQISNDADGPDENDTFLAVDGVERLIGGGANEQLNIDESEVNKDNYFDAAGEITLEDDDDPETTDDPDLVGDSIVYDHTDMNNDLAADDNGDIDDDNDGIVDFLDADNVAMDVVAVSMRPSLEVVVESDNEEDLIRMTGGTIIGSDTTVDTLVDVETIDVADAAISATLDDTLNVSNVDDAVVDFARGQIRDVGGDLYAQITGMTQLEHTLGGAGDDTVILANTMTNYRAYDITDVGTAISYSSFLNYDNVDRTTTLDQGEHRQALVNIPVDERPEANNQGLFTFDLAGGDDRVDYSLETGNIAAVIDLENGETTQTIFSMGADLALTTLDDRIDLMHNVEEVVASQAISILDFTGAGEDIEITFQYDTNVVIEELDRMESTIRIADGDGNTIDGISSFIEYYDMNDDDEVAPFVDATWNRIEGSDFGESVAYDGSEDIVEDFGMDHRYTTDTLNLRGGDNNVSYNDLETSITAVVNIVESDEDTTLTAIDNDLNYNTGSIQADITFQDGEGAALGGGGVHRIRSYTYDNDVAAGTLKLEASQDSEDAVSFGNSLSEKILIVGSSPGVIDINIADQQAMRLTGFEFLRDAGSNDVYQFDSLITGIEYQDTNGSGVAPNPDSDTDTISVTNDAVGYSANLPNHDLPVPQDDDIDLFELSDGINIDFDNLDVTRVTTGSVDLVGGSYFAQDEMVILDDLSLFESIKEFEAIKLAAGTTLTSALKLDLIENELKIGTHTIDIDGNIGLLDMEDVTTATVVDVIAAAGVNFEVRGGSGADAINGGSGDDIMAGNAGDDVINGGEEIPQVSTYTFNIEGHLTDDSADFITIAGLTVGPDANDSSNYDGPINTVPSDEDMVGQAFADISDVEWEAALEVMLGRESVAIDSVDYNGNTNVLSITFNPEEVNLVVVGDAVLTDADVDSTIGAPAEAPILWRGNGNDVIYGGAGVDVMSGGTGSDTFVVVGKVDDDKVNPANDDYAAGAAIGTAAANFDVAVDAIENGQKVSDVTTDVFNGGVGTDTIEVWGDVDMTKATWTSINVLEVHSDVILTEEQLEQLDITLHDEDSRIFIDNKENLALTGDATLEEMQDFADEYKTGGITNADGDKTIQLVITAGATAVNEGSAAVFTIVDGLPSTEYSYQIAGVSAADVVGGELTGSVITDAEGAGSISVNLVEDRATEGVETMTVTVDDESASVTVNDTSRALGLTADKTIVDETLGGPNNGNTVVYTIVDGLPSTEYTYQISGVNINASDVAGGLLTGPVTTDAAGAGSFSVNLAADQWTEGDETMTVTLDGKSVSVTVNDTSETDDGNIVPVSIGSIATFSGTVDPDTFTFDAVAALALTTADTVSQPTIDSFDVLEDTLRFDLPNATGATTLAALDGQQGVEVEQNPFTGDWLIDFGADANGGERVVITLSGVADAAVTDVIII